MYTRYMKLTKIVATIGPATESPETIKTLILSGVNVFRFNLKHNDLSWHTGLIETVRKISAKLGIPVGILIDLQGPEIRITIEEGEFEVSIGEKIGVGVASNLQKKLVLSHPQVISYLLSGQRIVIDDGRFTFKVETEGTDSCVLVSESTGVLKTRKTFNVPGAHFPLPVLTDKDREALVMAHEHPVDFVALSFVRSAQDIKDLQDAMKQGNVSGVVVSKIETRLALDDIDNIIAVSDGLMIARGDLGIELPIEEVPYYQKILIKKCIERGIPVITATQMLHSMTERPYPTRAEISDIANAAYDLTDSVMLSEETAAGKFPLEAVAVMAKTVNFSEKRVFIKDTRAIFDYLITGQEEMLCDTAYNLYLQLAREENSLGGFIVFTQTGRTARKLSRYRSHVPIFTFCPTEKVRLSLTASYGVVPLMSKDIFTQGQPVRIEDIQGAIAFLRENGAYEPRKHYIVMYGDLWMIEGKLSTIKVIPPQE